MRGLTARRFQKDDPQRDWAEVPTVAKNARMGHPQLWSGSAKTKSGPPALQGVHRPMLWRGLACREHQFLNSAGLWRPGRRTKMIALVIGGLFALLSIARPDGYGWMGAVLMSGAALILPVLQFRTLWSEARFWVVTALLMVVQIPLVIAVRPLVERLRAAFLLAFGIGDGLFVILMIVLLCSGLKAKHN
jgi:hypothetical protein